MEHGCLFCSLMLLFLRCLLAASELGLDMAKRAGRVRSIGSLVKTGHGSKRVIFKRVNWVAGQTGRELSWVASRVELTCIFQNIYIFF